ncbi:MAG: hypothetical protein HOD92_19240 [Deltaproteobacteria bacterium]|jgi:hypothetical protein|nr:hypothetical protein [Deltaproteobacteria bacterium]MBT4526629.1 hypothetical protein [Deltaproteobacteria bacterium]
MKRTNLYLFIILVTGLAFITDCANKKNSPTPINQPPRKTSSANQPESNRKIEITEADLNWKSQTNSSNTITSGYLEKEPEYKLAQTNDALEEQNTGSMIESKLFKRVEAAYSKRDQDQFLALYKFFLDSFPQSRRKILLNEYLNNFFYSETLDSVNLRGSLIEIELPAAKDWSELNQYFEDLAEKGIASVQLDLVQTTETPIFLFSNHLKKQGYYFYVKNRPLIDDILEKLVNIAHKNRLKILISLPLRHHPLIGHSSVLLMDEKWSAIQNETRPNRKLDLLNKAAKGFLNPIINSLLASDVDGIVFKDDFTYEITDGLSRAAIGNYQVATGRKIIFNDLFVAVNVVNDEEIGVLTTDEYINVAMWRTREIKQLLWDIVSRIRRLRADFLIGLDVVPEMVLDEKVSVKWHSTGLRFLKDLDIDFFKLKWKKFNTDTEADSETYKKALTALSEMSKKAVIYTKIPFNEQRKNVILLNEKISEVVKFQEDYKNTKTAIGDVNRLQKYDLIGVYD